MCTSRKVELKLQSSLKKEPVKTIVSARNEDCHEDTLAMYSVTM